MRFRLRTLLIVVTAFGALCGVARWWTSPFVVHRTSLNGTLTADEWYRRTLLGIEQIGLVQYRSSGKRAFEFRYEDGHRKERYWLHDGTEVSREEFFRQSQ